MPPVPKVVAWSSEHRFTVRPDPCIGSQLALFATLGGPGQGKPIYAELSHERQRAIVSGRACGICGCRLPTGSGFALLIPERPSTPADLRDLHLHEPLTCRACLALPLQHCPRIRAAVDAGLLEGLLVRGYDTRLLLTDLSDPDPEVALALRAARVTRAAVFVELNPRDFVLLSGHRLFAAAGLVSPVGAWPGGPDDGG